MTNKKKTKTQELGNAVRIVADAFMHGRKKVLSIAQPGFPIRKSTGRWLLSPHRGLSQIAASFVGSWCQGIPLALFVA